MMLLRLRGETPARLTVNHISIMDEAQIAGLQGSGE
jgi:hypothetical protein